MSELGAHFEPTWPVHSSATPVVEHTASQATEEVPAKPPDRDEIILAAERARAGCWMSMFSAVVLAVVIVVAVLIVMRRPGSPPPCTPEISAFHLTTITTTTVVSGVMHLSEPVLLSPRMSFFPKECQVELTYRWFLDDKPMQDDFKAIPLNPLDFPPGEHTVRVVIYMDYDIRQWVGNSIAVVNDKQHFNR